QPPEFMTSNGIVIGGRLTNRLPPRPHRQYTVVFLERRPNTPKARRPLVVDVVFAVLQMQLVTRLPQRFEGDLLQLLGRVGPHKSKGAPATLPAHMVQHKPRPGKRLSGGDAR